MSNSWVSWFETLGMDDVESVGGKNASLGEMINHLASLNVKVPGGFATTSDAFRAFLQHNGNDKKISAILSDLNIEDVKSLANAGKKIRKLLSASPLPSDLESAIREAYQQLNPDNNPEMAVAVRSSATAEDLPEASFAGQQETILNVRGIDAVLAAVKTVFASLFNDRAISYREHQGFEHHEIALSCGIQRMVRSDIGSSGVMFTVDTETGFDKAILINSAYGLGEMVVQGAVNPDEFYVYKPNVIADKPCVLSRHLGSKREKMIYAEADSQETIKTVDVPETERTRFSLTDTQITALAKMAITIETHYDRPMDIEWGLDGIDGELYILQARPETVQSRSNKQVIERFAISERSKVLAQGRSVGQRIGQGRARVVNSIEQMHEIQAGDVLVTDMTDPDWEPVMKIASAIVTNRGGRTCHAAIIARELGIPAIVGCGDATRHISDNQDITVSCAQGDTGFVYEGLLPFEHNIIDVNNMPTLPTKIMLNVGNPERAFTFQALPNSGVGLARLEFIISNTIGIHPKALLEYETRTPGLKAQIDATTAAYPSPIAYYQMRLQEGLAMLASAFYPKPVIARLSDFKSNEYANLLGGSDFEPHEENPMIGYRGASRYISPDFKACFALECLAVKTVRETMGLDNLQIMIPFVRTLTEARQVIEILKENGLERTQAGLKIIMMCEVPSNAILAKEFLEYFDGFSIGSNDLTQLTLGLDRDSGLVAQGFDERDPAVKALLRQAIQAALSAGKYVGICGQGPSDHPDFAQWLVGEGIESVSLNPDTVIETSLALSKTQTPNNTLEKA